MENDLRRPDESDWEAFERGVDAALASAPKPRAKLRTESDYRDLCIELRGLVEERSRSSFGRKRLARLLQEMDKLLIVEFSPKVADGTNKQVVSFKPTDAFVRFAAVFRACDWQQVFLIEHEIISF